ncbi:Caprin-1 [Amphibalanus amphitrite]|uniref:Caprin-1 n=1 Tax=Amphibalanus amphitrite TaxID=1232801 RepID=A0A6A4VL29_AMPAM|nr:Caprin-1 [Amphibalanus amphitrite]
MPSVEVKQENMASENADPFQKAMTYLKFKIKNMEQRKKNLTAIKEKLDAGLEKQLEVEQVQAAAKLPEVAGNITFLEQTLARLQTHHDEHAKLDRQRKQAAKQERLQHDLERVRRILMLQDTLMGIDDRVREDLLSGARGAPQLSDAALQQIDTIFKLVTPSREDTDVPFKDQLSTAAEHLLRLADRSQKKISGTTYEALAKTLEAVFESGVLSEPEPEAEPEPEPEPEPENGLQPEGAAPAVPEAAAVEPPEPAAAEPPAGQVALAPGPAPGSAGDSPPYPQEVLLHPAAAAPPAGLVPVPMPVPVAAPAPPPQPSINFLQESELLRPAEPAAVEPAAVRFPAAEYHAIPSQTFTNTNFAGLPAAAALSELAAANAVYAGAVVDTTPNPPPPIPLPNHEPAAPPPPAAAPAPPAAAAAPAPAEPAPPAPEVNAWASRAADPAPAASGGGATWGDGERDTEIGQWDGGASQTWDNGKTDTWENGGDSHWGGADGRRGGYRGGRGGARSRGPSNGFGARGRGGYDRPPRSSRGGYGEERRAERAGPSRGGPAGAERPYRAGRGGPAGGARGAPRGARGGPARPQ